MRFALLIIIALIIMASPDAMAQSPGVSQLNTIISWVTALMAGIGTLALIFAGIGFFSGRFQWQWLCAIGVGLLIAAIAAQIVSLFGFS